MGIRKETMLITGASGICGSALLGLEGRKVLYDLKEPTYDIGENVFIKGDMNDHERLEEAMKGCDIVIHLGGSSDPASSWEDVLRNNIMTTQSVLEAARELNVKKVIFGSSNRVFQMYEVQNAPGIYEIGFGLMIHKNTPVRPSTYYGISKACCETICRTFAESGGPRCYVIRIGSVRGQEENHPYAYAEGGVKKGIWKRNSKQYQLHEKRLKSIWMSRRDFLQMVALCIDYEATSFDVFFGISDNPRSWFDVEYAKKSLGYNPMDNAEQYKLALKD